MYLGFLEIAPAGLVGIEHTQAQAGTDVQLDRTAFESAPVVNDSLGAVLCQSTATVIVTVTFGSARS